MRNSEGKTYILLAPFHLIVYNRPREFQNSSDLFSLVGKCLQTWEEEWEREALNCHDGFGALNISLRTGIMDALRTTDGRPLSYGLLFVNAHVEQHREHP